MLTQTYNCLNTSPSMQYLLTNIENKMWWEILPRLWNYFLSHITGSCSNWVIFYLAGSHSNLQNDNFALSFTCINLLQYFLCFTLGAVSYSVHWKVPLFVNTIDKIVIFSGQNDTDICIPLAAYNIKKLL